MVRYPPYRLHGFECDRAYSTTASATAAFATVMAIDTLGTYNTVKATIDQVKKTKGSFIAISATLHYKV